MKQPVLWSNGTHRVRADGEVERYYGKVGGWSHVSFQGHDDALRWMAKELAAWKKHALGLRALTGVYNSVVETLPAKAQEPFGRAGVAIVGCALLNSEPKSTLEEQQAGYARYCELLGRHASKGGES